MRSLVAGTLVVGLAPSSVLAQAVLGPARCTSCHDHARQTRQWQQEEPARPGGRAHVNALRLLDAPKALSFARAAGLVSAWSASGACVRCHGTVFRGDANAGVSCESCHGPGRDYIELHQKKGAHAAAVAAGMSDLRGKPAAIASLCVSCHAVSDRRIVGAGHPSGAGFDAGAGLRQIVHWTTSYDYAQVSAAARVALSRVAAVGPAPEPSGGAAAGPTPLTPGSAGSSAAGRWQGARPLPPDYVPENLPRALPEGRGIASESGLGEVLALRGRGLVLLARAVQSGERLQAPARTSPPAEFAGPEGELLRIQDELYALLLGTLARPER